MKDPTMGTNEELGHHVCYVNRSEPLRRQRLAQWVSHGLARRERVVHVETGERAGELMAVLDDHRVPWRRAVETSDLLVRSPAELHLFDGMVDSARRMAELARFVDDSVAAGYAGVRLSTDATVALSVLGGIDALRTYEQCLDDLCRSHPIVALCVYDHESFGDGLGSQLRGCHSCLQSDWAAIELTGTGARFSGELDQSNEALFREALAAVEWTDESVIDLTELSFVDVGNVSTLLDGRRQPITVIGAPASLVRIVEVLGWQDRIRFSPAFPTTAPGTGC